MEDKYLKKLDDMASKYLDNFRHIGNFQQSMDSGWKVAAQNGHYKKVGILHFDVDITCGVQLWYDENSGKKRWWFGYSFENKKAIELFLKKSNLHNIESYIYKFDNGWLNRILREKWKGEKEYYLGIYSKSTDVCQSQNTIIETANIFSETDYYRLNRKYSSGESPEHKKLKKLIYEYPNLINLKNIKEKKIEYPFRNTADRVDLLFKLNTGEEVVVEIETDNPLPGGFQTIKYRSLRCAELDEPLDSNQVSAILVAWHIPKKVETFCKKYDIKFFQVKP